MLRLTRKFLTIWEKPRLSAEVRRADQLLKPSERYTLRERERGVKCFLRDGSVLTGCCSISCCGNHSFKFSEQPQVIFGSKRRLAPKAIVCKWGTSLSFNVQSRWFI